MERILASSPFLCGIRNPQGDWPYLNDALRRWVDGGGKLPAADHDAGAPAAPQNVVNDGNGGQALLTATAIPWHDRDAILYCGYDVSAVVQAYGGHPPALAAGDRLLDAFVHPVVAVDGEARVTACNPAAAPYLNTDAEQVRGLALAEVLNLGAARATGTGLAGAITAAVRSGYQGGHTTEAALVRRDGAEVPVRITVSMLGGEGRTGALVVFEDLSEVQRRHSQLSMKARHDPLTGLINREEFVTRLGRLLARAGEQRWDHSLCFLDLDQFKAVNDTAGHAAGDELLRQVTTALLIRVRGRDTLARIGGDEFAILLEHCPLEEAREVAEKLRQAVAELVFEWEGLRHGVGASIGLVPIHGSGVDAARVMAMADAACYQAKHGGRNRVCVLETDEDNGGPRMIESLRRALVENALLLHAQPVLALGTEPAEVRAREVLVRLPTGGGIASPHEFVPATRHRLNVEMDRWVLEHLATVTPQQEVPLMVNVGAASMQDRGFLEYLASRPRGGPRICLDVREAALIESGSAATPFCDAARHGGWELAVAVGGDGPSAAYMLETLRPDLLTMDLRRLKDGDRPFRRRHAAQLLELGRLVGATTVATHVEEAGLLELARQLGFDWVQGYLMGAPEPFAA